MVVDFSDCEKEPVRFIGAIQPFGALLRTNSKNIITHYSANFQEITGQDGKTLLGQEFSLQMLDVKKFSLSILKHLDGKIIEIEKQQNQSLLNINPYLDQMQTCLDLGSLLQSASEVMARVSGFERVLIYKFHEDAHGEVVAETVASGVESFMGLHFPSSDIPPQARSIFLENWVRMIPQVSYVPVAILGKDSPEGIDLGKSLLRAVSPIHLEYLKNMNVGASLTISIIVDGKLWGLFACHNTKPLYLQKSVRDNCETLGRFCSSLIRDINLKEISQHASYLEVIHRKLISKISHTDDLSKELTENSPTLVDIIKSDGAAAALYVDGYWATIGDVPDETQLDELVNWIGSEHPGDIYYTNELSKVFPKAEPYKFIASGVLATSIPKMKRSYILWFRPEIIQTVKWAGNPDKVVDSVNGRLTPRASFEEWRQSVKGTSLPWKIWEIDAALELRNSVLALDLRRQFEKEQKARADAERAILAREELMAVVSHDLKNPLSSILMNAQLIKRFVQNPADKSWGIADRIHKSSVTMNNLIEDILSVTKLEAGHLEIDQENAPLHTVIDEAIELIAPMAHDKAIKLERNKHSVECNAKYDHGRMLQVFSNIIGNAIKFTPNGGSISVNIDKCGPEFALISIKDSGPGIPKEHLPNVFDRFWQANQTKRMGTGLGLAIVKGIVEKHGGEIWAESELGHGATFFIKLPAKMGK